MPTARGKPSLRKFSPRWRKYLKLFLISTFVLGLFGLTQNLYLSWQHRIWLPETRLTVVVGTENPTIYSYDPQNEKLIKFQVPKNTEIETSGDYGNWLAGSLWGLGEQENLQGELLRSSLQKSLGIPIDAWVDVGGEELFVYRSLGRLSATFEAFRAHELQTNLTFFDRVNLLLRVSNLGIRERQEIDLTDMGIIVKKKLGDGEAGFIVIPERAKVSLERLRDTLVFEEEKKVIVANASKKGGLAQEVAQIGSVLGVRVIGTQNLDQTFDGCLVSGNQKELQSFSAKRLKTIFGCSLQEKEASGAADLELILGRDVLKKF